ncbi:MAG TPA: PAS domain-containing sensor histidine kinase [Bacteroidetes bacterium]|nr:PAS domain-containing sensor histidine kinase [Bacteroidota bacterium]
MNKKPKIKVQSPRKKVLFIVALMFTISTLHYLTFQQLLHFHAVYRVLIFVPMILSGFWFGLTGALFILGGYLVFYLPYIFAYWEGFSVLDLEKILSVILFSITAVIFGSMSDRERRRQIQLQEIKAMAYLGNAISMAAHEIKTPLVSIGGFTRIVRNQLQCSDPNYEKLNIVLNETKRLENLVNEMLDYSRKMELNRKLCDLHGFLQKCLGYFQHVEKEYYIRLNINPENRLPAVQLDDQKMKQVMINIINNAIEASPIGESVIIATDCNSSRVFIDVIDSGEGISPDCLDSVFQPFFTTKKKGTGLGLPIAKKIIEAHGGQINILGNSGKGVTVRIALTIT